jgi:hypothetical protein
MALTNRSGHNRCGSLRILKQRVALSDESNHPKEKGKVYCTHLDDNSQQCSKYTYDGPMTTHQGNMACHLESDHKFFESDAHACVAEASKEGMRNFVMKVRTRAPMLSEDQKAMTTNLAIALCNQGLPLGLFDPCEPKHMAVVGNVGGPGFEDVKHYTLPTRT